MLVALDGSQLGERVLPYVEALAEKFGASVILLRATTPPATLMAETAAGAMPLAGPVIDPTPIIEAKQEDASAYLETVGRRLRNRGIAVEHDEPAGSVDDGCRGRARRLGADLIAMTTQ